MGPDTDGQINGVGDFLADFPLSCLSSPSLLFSFSLLLVVSDVVPDVVPDASDEAVGSFTSPSIAAEVNEALRGAKLIGSERTLS